MRHWFALCGISEVAGLYANASPLESRCNLSGDALRFLWNPDTNDIKPSFASICTPLVKCQTP